MLFGKGIIAGRLEKGKITLVVESAPTSQWLLWATSSVKISESYEHKIGGNPATLPDRVMVMALDWLRKLMIDFYLINRIVVPKLY